LQLLVGKLNLNFVTLKEALGLKKEGMLCLIGAGGKTTALFRLAHELWEEGNRVLVTTTTKIFKPIPPQVQGLYLARDPALLLRKLAMIKEAMVVGAGRGLDDAGKLVGLPTDWFPLIEQRGVADWILVEADGAASRPFKVPLEHEPVVPQECPLTVWVMGMKVLSRPLTPEWVHRAERAASLLGVEVGTAVTEDHILRLLGHPLGCMKGIPLRSRRVALINQADSAGEEKRASDLGRALIRQGIERVVITSYIQGDVVRAVIQS
jgi:probable selenium-dependent hydroxylase accessory protein YqeC